jgi:hypothetical protein
MNIVQRHVNKEYIDELTFNKWIVKEIKRIFILAYFIVPMMLLALILTQKIALLFPIGSCIFSITILRKKYYNCKEKVKELEETLK